MPDLLYLSHRIPYPPFKGEKIRPLHIIRHLRDRYRIHLGCLIDDRADWAHVPVVRELCADAYFAPLNPRVAKIACLRGLATGAPLTLPYFWNHGLARWVETVLTEVKPEVVLIFSSAMAQYVLPHLRQVPLSIMDFADVDSDKWLKYAETTRWPMSWIYGRESRRLLACEREAARATDASVLVSEPEVALFRSLAPESADKIISVSNGVDANHFSPEHDFSPPFDSSHPTFVFTGIMDYWPNVDGVVWFATEILPRVRRRVADARFVIVGADPAPVVMGLANLPGVTVTGRVADVRPYLAHAVASVAPMRIARGIQNKVLEAMAMAKPTIVTPQALEGIEAAPGVEVVLADDTAALAEAASQLAEAGDSAAIGAAARRRVIESYSWPARLAALDELLANGRAGETPRAALAADAAP